MKKILKIIIFIIILPNNSFGDKIGFNDKRVDTNLYCTNGKNKELLGFKKFDDKILALIKPKIKELENGKYGIPVSIAIKQKHHKADSVYTFFETYENLFGQKAILWRRSIFFDGDKIFKAATIWKADEKKVSEFLRIQDQANNELNRKKFVKLLEEYTSKLVAYYKDKDLKSKKPILEVYFECVKY